MFNPNCAIERVKNHLAYKIGECVLSNKNRPLLLIYQLYKIKKQHIREKKLYQTMVKLFPSMIYPALEDCDNYKESIKIKFNLSYMLGQSILKADKSKFKIGYFRLLWEIDRVKKEYRNIKIFLEQYDLFIKKINNLNEDKYIDLLIKNFISINNILYFHRDYLNILNLIFSNFNYFLEHFDLIEEWLLSNDFNEKYKKENHPYPPLLDSKKTQ